MFSKKYESGDAVINRLVRHGALVTISLVFIYLAASSIQKESLVRDEPVHFQFGMELLTRGTETTPNRGVGATSILNAYSLISENQDLRMPGNRTVARIPTIIMGGLLVYLTGLFGMRLFGFQGGALAAVLAAFEPNLIAHGRLVTTDLSMSLGVLWAVYMFWRIHERPALHRFILAGVASGFAILAKANSLFLVLIAPIFFSISCYHARNAATHPSSSMQKWITYSVVFFLSTYIAVNAGFGFQGFGLPVRQYDFHSGLFESIGRMLPPGTPLPAPSVFLKCLDLSFWSGEVGHPGANFFLGKYSDEPSSFYFIVAFLIKSTLGFLVLVALSIVFRNTKNRSNSIFELYLWTPVLFLFCYFSFFNSINIGLRYILAVYPLLCVSAGRLLNATGKKPIRMVVMALLLFHMAESISIKPHYLEFFNMAVGGPGQGYKYLNDSNLDWGQDQEILMEYAEASPEQVVITPDEPVNGLVAVNANRMFLSKFEWIKRHPLVDRVAYTWFIYKVEGEKETIHDVRRRKTRSDSPRITERLIGPDFTDKPPPTLVPAPLLQRSMPTLSPVKEDASSIPNPSR